MQYTQIKKNACRENPCGAAKIAISSRISFQSQPGVHTTHCYCHGSKPVPAKVSQAGGKSQEYPGRHFRHFPCRTRGLAPLLLTGEVADRAGQFYERCKKSGERSKKTRKLKGSQANQLRARYAAQSTSQGPASLGDYGHKHGVGTNHTPAAKSQVNQTHPTTNHHLALPPS